MSNLYQAVVQTKALRTKALAKTASSVLQDMSGCTMHLALVATIEMMGERLASHLIDSRLPLA